MRIRLEQVALNVAKIIKNPLGYGHEYYLGMTHLDPNTLQISRRGFIKDGFPPSFNREFTKGDILFCTRSLEPRKVAVADFSGVCSVGLLIIRSLPNDLFLPQMLPFIIQSDSFFQWAGRHSRGSVSTRIKWSSLSNYEFYLPSLNVQYKIVQVLETIEKCIFQCKKLLNLIKEEKKNFT